MNNTSFNIPGNVDYSKYGQEQIHIPGHIQPHGVLIALQKTDLTVLQVSENINHFFCISAESLIGKNIDLLLSPPQIQLITDYLETEKSTFIKLLEISTYCYRKATLFIAILHEYNGLLIIGDKLSL